MVLQSSGQISFADIQTEFGGTNPIEINEYYTNNASGFTNNVSGLPTTGNSISLQQFYGKAKYVAPIRGTTLAFPSSDFDDNWLTYNGSSTLSISARYVDFSQVTGYIHSHSSTTSVSGWIYIFTNNGTYTAWSTSTTGSVNLPTNVYDMGSVVTVTGVRFYSYVEQGQSYHGVGGSVILRDPTVLTIGSSDWDSYYIPYNGSTTFSISARYINMSALSGYAHSHGSAVSAWLYVVTNNGTYTVWSVSLDVSSEGQLSKGTYDLGAYRNVTSVYFDSSPGQGNTFHGVSGSITLS